MTSQAGLDVTLQIRIHEVLGSSLGRTPAVLAEVFMVLLIPSRQILG
jgi:hypothetical protein